LSFSSVFFSISEEIINSAIKKDASAILRLVWRHKITCNFKPVLFYWVLLQIFPSPVTWYRVIWWIITDVLEVLAASLFKYNCDSNTFLWSIRTYLPLLVKIRMGILIDAGTKHPKSTVVRDVLRTVTVSLETWITSGENMWKAVIYSANPAILKYTASVEEIIILMFWKRKKIMRLLARLCQPVQMNLASLLAIWYSLLFVAFLLILVFNVTWLYEHICV